MTKAGQAIQQMLVSATEQETAYDDLETVVSVLPGVSRISDDQIMSLAPLTQGDISMYSIPSLVDKLGAKEGHTTRREALVNELCRQCSWVLVYTSGTTQPLNEGLVGFPRLALLLAVRRCQAQRR